MLDGVNSNKQVSETKYTLETLGIQQGSKEASIFNEIDMSDGKLDGELNSTQYLRYKYEIAKSDMKTFEEEKLSEQEKKLAEELELLNRDFELKHYYLSKIDEILPSDVKMQVKDWKITIKEFDIVEQNFNSANDLQRLLEIVMTQVKIHESINKMAPKFGLE